MMWKVILLIASKGIDELFLLLFMIQSLYYNPSVCNGEN